MPKNEAIGPQVTLPVAAKQAASAPGETLKACALVRREGRWVLLELTIAGGVVTASRQVDAQYYRDLAEQSAAKWLRRAGR